jgi:hypothetical protein
MDFNPVICTTSKSPRAVVQAMEMDACQSRFFNLHPRSKRQFCLIQKKSNLSGMQLSRQSKEIGNLYKLKISYLISISGFFSPKRCIISP